MPSKSLKSSIYAGLMLLAFSGQAQSATLTGDSVSVKYNDSSLPIYNGSGIVGAGTDVTIGGGFYDFNAGAGNQFIFSVNNRYCGVAHCNGAIKVSLLNLNFSGGEKLVGFTLLSTALRGLTFTFTSTSLIFLATERSLRRGTVISGIFLTEAPPPPVDNIPAAVPIPAALPLLASALGLFAWFGRRERIAAKAT